MFRLKRTEVGGVGGDQRRFIDVFNFCLDFLTWKTPLDAEIQIWVVSHIR